MARLVPHKKHGESPLSSRSKEYTAWLGMKQRCKDKNAVSWHRYGGRGIKVCDRWLNDFPAFLADVGRRPGNGYELDRINNDGDYEPSNVRWVTRKKGSTNRSTNIVIEINGIIKCASEWAEVCKVDRHTICRRYHSGIRGEQLLKRRRRPKRFATDAEQVAEALR